MRAFVVKTADGYLCPRDGDVGYAQRLEDAGHFMDEDEAAETAELIGYSSGNFKVVPVAVDALNRQ